MTGAGNRHVIYVSAISCTGTSGQNVFEIQWIDEFRRMADHREGLSMAVFCASDGEAPEEFAADGRIRILCRRKKTYSGYIRFQWWLLWWLGRDLWRNRGSDTYMYLRYHDSMAAPLLLSCIFRFRLTVRTGPVLSNLSIYGKNPNFVVCHGIRLMLGGFCRRASRIITVTEKIKQWVADTYPPARDKIVVVPNGVRTEVFRPFPSGRDRWGLPGNEIVAGFVGHIYGDQGLATVLGAMNILREQGRQLPYLLVVGDGPDLAGLKEAAGEMDLTDRIRWAGKVPFGDVASAINACDVMLAPFRRRVFETAGSSATKLFEYLACDRPVIVSRGPDHMFIEENGLGVLVEPEDEEKWAEALAGILAVKRGLAGRGRDYVKRRHSYEALADRTIGHVLGEAYECGEGGT